MTLQYLYYFYFQRGHIFFDRDGYLFEIILAFARVGHFTLPPNVKYVVFSDLYFISCLHYSQILALHGQNSNQPFQRYPYFGLVKRVQARIEILWLVVLPVSYRKLMQCKRAQCTVDVFLCTVLSPNFSAKQVCQRVTDNNKGANLSNNFCIK